MQTDDLWFTTARTDIHLSNKANARGLSIIEHTMAHGFSPPRHVHYEEDETFHVLAGEVRFEMNGTTLVARPGDTVHAPAGTPHCFVVVSPQGARFLTVTLGGFEDMVREASRPAANDGLPEQAPPTPDQQRMLAAAALRHGIELIGAPLAA